jgi:hypothetical protein
LGQSEQKSRKDGVKPEKASFWQRRPRMTSQKGRRIVDNSTSGKIHPWMLWSTAQKEKKDRLAKP